MTETKHELEERAYSLVCDHDNLISELIAMRINKGLSQATVGERMGVSTHAVEAFEHYDANPSLSVVRRYALAVGASLKTEVINAASGENPID